MKAAMLILILPMLAGCPGNRRPDPPTVPKVVEVVVTKFVPVPAELAADCQDTKPTKNTYSEAKRLALLRREFLEECTARMRKIRGLAK